MSNGGTILGVISDVMAFETLRNSCTPRGKYLHLQFYILINIYIYILVVKFRHHNMDFKRMDRETKRFRFIKTPIFKNRKGSYQVGTS